MVRLRMCAARAALAFALTLLPFSAWGSASSVTVQGPGHAPHLGFACCDQSIESSARLMADPAVISALRDLHADVAVALPDFSPQRAEVVRRINQAGIPAIAWMMLPQEQGYYLNAANADQAAARVAAFEKWTADEQLHWAAVGLDVEPNFAELQALRGHPRRLAATFLARSLDGRRLAHAQRAYDGFVAGLRAHGYRVQIYQMPYVPAEQETHSTLPDRLLGTVDLRGDENYLMLYTSFARPIGAGMIWSLGPQAQAIAIGSTDGEGTPGTGSGSLDWDEFLRDLMVASHFTRQIGIYDLEGCVRQGFLSRLESVNWSQSVEIPAESVQKAKRMGMISRGVLRFFANLPWIIAAALLLIAWWVVRRQRRRDLKAMRT